MRLILVLHYTMFLRNLKWSCAFLCHPICRPNKVTERKMINSFPSNSVIHPMSHILDCSMYRWTRICHYLPPPPLPRRPIAFSWSVDRLLEVHKFPGCRLYVLWIPDINPQVRDPGSLHAQKNKNRSFSPRAFSVSNNFCNLGHWEVKYYNMMFAHNVKKLLHNRKKFWHHEIK